MDVITVVEKYIELSVRRDNLKDTVGNSKRYYDYAKAEGDMAFYDRNYQSEKGYNDSAMRHMETQKGAERDLAQVEQLLEFTYQTYTETAQSLDQVQLDEASIIMSVKKSDVERKIADLSQRREWAISKGDAAFASHNLQEEQEYNRISSDCRAEIERIKPTVQYYDAFAKDLSKRAHKDFGPTGPVR